MNKNDLIQKLSDTTGLPKNDAAKAVDGVFDLIAASLKAGDEVRLTGFGVFVVATRAGRQGPQSPDRRGNHHQAVQAAALPRRQAAQGFAELMRLPGAGSAWLPLLLLWLVAHVALLMVLLGMKFLLTKSVATALLLAAGIGLLFAWGWPGLRKLSHSPVL